MKTINSGICNGITRLFSLILILLVATAGMAVAQPANMEDKGPKDGMGLGPFEGAFYPPKLIMRYQSEIDLSEEQRKTIISLMNENHPRHNEIKWNLEAEMQEMRELIKQQTVDLEQANAKLDTILEMEEELKKLQLAVMVKIKNSLTAEQQAELDEYKSEIRERRSKMRMKQRMGQKRGK